MGESRERASSSVNLKETGSLLDFDMGKDFLSNWKPKSDVKDDAMDLDFGPVMKNKKKPFDFDKVDIDFNIDGDFGKLSSFKIDMSDFDVSSPIKKDGKHKEKPKEASSGGSTRGKANSFDFSFDFNKLDSFTVESSLRKKKDARKDQVSGDSASRDDCRDSRIHMAKEVDVLGAGMSQKLTSSDSVGSSNLQGGVRAHLDPTREDSIPESVKRNHDPPKSVTAIEEVALLTEETSSQKSIHIRIQQRDSVPENTSSAGTVAQETCIAKATLPQISIPASGTDSSGDTTSELQEEVSSLATKMNIASSIEQAKRSTSNSCENFNLSLPDVESVQIMKSSSPERENTPIKTAHRLPDPASLEPSRLDSSNFKLSSKENKNVTSDQDEGGSESSSRCQYYGVQSTKDERVPEDGMSLQPIALDVLRSSSTNAQHGSKGQVYSSSEVATPKSLRNEKGPPKSLTVVKDVAESVTAIKEILVQKEETSAQISVPNTTQQMGSVLENRSSAEPITQEPCAANKIIPVITVRSVSTSNNSHMTTTQILKNPLTGENSLVRPARWTSSPPGTKLSLPNMTTTQILKNPDKGENSLVRPARRTPSPPGTQISRASEANPSVSRSMSDKEMMSLGNLMPNKFPLGDMQNKVSRTADSRKGTVLTMSLKRKTPEAPDADMTIANPSKRLSQSPCENRNIAEISEKIVEKEVCENMAGHNARSILENSHASPVSILQEMNVKELESPYTAEDDSNIEKAEACSKELEDICNTLRKKHEEAKDILVRAIVNNNKLLMLNHPLYEEKIRMIQKFAASLTLTNG